jgi:DNA repair exonuclease SbcCD ATPase subunit
LGSVGVLILGIYFAFFSPLTDALEAELRAQNAVLIVQRERLVEEVSMAETRLEEIRQLSQATNRRLSDAEIALIDRAAELQGLRDELEGATAELQQVNVDLASAGVARRVAEDRLRATSLELDELDHQIEALTSEAIIEEIGGDSGISLYTVFAMTVMHEVSSEVEIEQIIRNAHTAFTDRLEARAQAETLEPRMRALNALLDRWRVRCGSQADWQATILERLQPELEALRNANSALAAYELPGRENREAFMEALAERQGLSRSALEAVSNFRVAALERMSETARDCLTG